MKCDNVTKIGCQVQTSVNRTLTYVLENINLLVLYFLIVKYSLLFIKKGEHHI